MRSEFIGAVRIDLEHQEGTRPTTAAVLRRINALIQLAQQDDEQPPDFVVGKMRLVPSRSKKVL